MRSRTAACSRGQLRIEVQREPLGIGVCHCLACQRRTGGPILYAVAHAGSGPGGRAVSPIYSFLSMRSQVRRRPGRSLSRWRSFHRSIR